jgi:catechol 2,3-dioxygenase-like lactoylglutathione lyase family enzyme
MTSTSTATTIKFASVTPNLIVRDVATSIAFYRDILGFEVKETVPDQEPFAFVWLTRDGVPVFLNDIKAVEHEYAGADGLTRGGTVAMFFVISGVDAYHAMVAPKVNIVMPLKTQFYGMREFAISDPDGHIITFAERVSVP